VDAQKAARALAQALPADQARRDVRLAMHCYTQPSLVFYCRREVIRWEKEEDALLFLQGPLPSYLFVPEKVWATLGPRLPFQARLVARHFDMYSGQMIVLVTNEGRPPEPGLAGKTPGEGE
jgi:hypothetical protein